MTVRHLSMTSDYATSTGNPEPSLRRIAEAGFSHVHWCHQWSTDFVYVDCEIEAIGRWMRGLGLRLTDVHGSAGAEKNWGSAVEHERLAGVELVCNRIDFAARLGSDVVIMHLPAEPAEPAANARYWATLLRSIDAVEPFARARGVRIALENLANGNFDTIERLFASYGPDVLGLCYDSGHGNMTGDGLERLDRLKDRLISVHLHDNDGRDDLHMRLFTGTIAWPRLARLIAASPYRKPVSMEVTMRHHPDEDEAPFLQRAFGSGATFARMVAEARSNG